jgi:uncharacterized glyoxalase superfamily protein PhnB
VLQNRSVPTGIMLAHVFYSDVTAAIEWLTSRFGLTEHYRYGAPVAGAQLHLGAAWIMLSEVRAGRATPAECGNCTQMLSLFLEDVDAHFAHSQQAGATIIEPLHETIYGERQYVAADPWGHHWLFSRHVRDVYPAEWGAEVSQSETHS